MNLKPKKKDLAAEWREARLLHPLYSALAREFVIDLPACDDLKSGADNSPQESVEQARAWLLEMDERIQVHQLRQFLQTTSLTSEEALQTLLEHHLYRESRLDSDRDKIDFLLVQYFFALRPLAFGRRGCRPGVRRPDAGSSSWEPRPDAAFVAATSRRFHPGCRRVPQFEPVVDQRNFGKRQKAQGFGR